MWPSSTQAARRGSRAAEVCCAAAHLYFYYLYIYTHLGAGSPTPPPHTASLPPTPMIQVGGIRAERAARNTGGGQRQRHSRRSRGSGVEWCGGLVRYTGGARPRVACGPPPREQPGEVPERQRYTVQRHISTIYLYSYSSRRRLPAAASTFHRVPAARPCGPSPCEQPGEVL